MEYTKALLMEIGLEPERLEMFHVGASDAPAWVRAVTEMTERAQRLGPNPLKKKDADFGACDRQGISEHDEIRDSQG